MKRATFLGILLTFLMALLVLGAVVIFLRQARSELLLQREALEIEVTRLYDEAQNIEAIAMSLEDSLATRQAEFDRSQQEVIDLQQALSTQEAAAPVPTASLLQSEPPYIEIVTPQSGDAFFVGEAVEFIVFVAHNDGLDSIRLALDGATFDTILVNGLPYQTVQRDRFIGQPGAYHFTVVATSTTGLVSSAPGVEFQMATRTETPAGPSGLSYFNGALGRHTDLFVLVSTPLELWTNKRR